MRIDGYAEWPHYADHLLPIWRALPDDVRGTFYASREVASSRPELTEGVPDHRSPDSVLVAGFSSHHAVRPRPTILLNHGAGQPYAMTKGAESFSGGPGRGRVLLHLEWGPLAARASEAVGYPYAQVGCPMLDPYHHTSPIPPAGIVAVALHHNGRGAPEQESAWRAFEGGFRQLAEVVEVVGHGHPRGWERTANRWTQMGVEPVADINRVMDTAALLITDISSIGPMFASTGRPVVWISAPWHLAAPESGGRFHEWTRTVEAVGGHVTDPQELPDVVRRHLAWPQELVAAQRPIVEDVFVRCDGLAARRAADLIVLTLGRVEADVATPAAP